MKARQRAIGPRTCQGFSLIELMVALTLGFFVVIACIAAYLGAAQASRVSQAQGRMNEDGQAALVILAQQLRMAGNNPDRSGRVDNTDPSLSSRRNPVYGPTTFATGTYVPSLFSVRGCNGLFTNIGTATNLDGLNCPGGVSVLPDSLAVSYEADGFNTTPTAITDGAVPTDCLGNKLATITAAVPTVLGAGVVLTNVTYTMADNRFYIATDGTLNTPGLYCKGNGLASTAQSMVDDVEDMKFTYGALSMATTAASAPAATVAGYLRADELNALSVSTNDPAPWGQVLSVRICVLVRSESNLLSDTVSARYLKCDGTLEMNPPDQRMRQAYFSTVVLRNRRL